MKKLVIAFFGLIAVQAVAADFLPDLSKGKWERTILDTKADDGTRISQDFSTYLWEGNLTQNSDEFTLEKAVFENNTWYSATGKLSSNTLLLKVTTPNYQGEREITKYNDKYIVVSFKHATRNGKVYSRVVYSLRKLE